jgi:hypothetical protein
MRTGLRRRPDGRRILTALVVLVVASSGTAFAHAPDPILSGGLFGQDQVLRYRWRDGAVPPGAIRAAITAAAADSNGTKASRAPTFVFDAGAANPIGYGAGATCGPNGIACFTRNAPNGFTMWLREHGRVFDWGRLRWCQMLEAPADGCHDAENIALDEFGHVLVLHHHANRADESDYLDAVVQTFSRTRPRAGWNAHAYGRCDVASLQREYDVPAWTTRYSTCLDLATTLTIAASATSVAYGGSVTLTATLKVGSATEYKRLRSNPISARTVTLQRRSVGTTSWSTVGPMASGATAGRYALAVTVWADSEFRAVFGEPADEGLRGATSSFVRVVVGSCTQACPVRLSGGVR